MVVHYSSKSAAEVDDQALSLLKIKKDAGNQFRRCVPAGTPCRIRVQRRRPAVQGVRPSSAHFSRQKKLTWGFLMFYSWYLADGICVITILARGIVP